jgi:hypothetical protein
MCLSNDTIYASDVQLKIHVVLSGFANDYKGLVSLGSAWWTRGPEEEKLTRELNFQRTLSRGECCVNTYILLVLGTPQVYRRWKLNTQDTFSEKEIKEGDYGSSHICEFWELCDVLGQFWHRDLRFKSRMAYRNVFFFRLCFLITVTSKLMLLLLL